MQESVCNLNGDIPFTVRIGYDDLQSGNQQAATAFTTGTAAGYDLRSVRLWGGGSAVGSPGRFVVAIHEEDGGGVGDTIVGTLTGAAPSGSAANDYAASGRILLNPSTTYFLVLSAPDEGGPSDAYYSPSLNLSPDQVGASGWSIGDQLLLKLVGDGETPDEVDFAPAPDPDDPDEIATVAIAFAVVADITAPAGAPRKVDVTAGAMGTEITVTWEAPQPTDGGVPTGYEVCVVEAMMEFTDANCDDGNPLAARSGVGLFAETSDVFTHTRTGLTAGTEYAVAVRGDNADGESVWVTPSAGGEQIAIDSGAAIARAITSITNNAIANRITQARDGGGDFNLAQTTSHILAAQDGDLGDGVKAILDGSVFAWSAKSNGGSTPSFWASGDQVLDMGSDDDASNWDGDVLSTQLGADTRMSNGNLIGAAISHSQSEIDYDEAGAKGEQKLTLTALHPYIGWRAANVDADLWASLAYGTGDLEHKVGDDTTTNDATLIGGAFGGAVSIGDNARMHAKIETARLTLDNAAEDQGDLEVDAHRARFGAEWSHTTRNGDATLRRGLTGGARYDGGDGITGVAAEVGANIGYDNGAGTALTARLWTLAAHDADYDEWGAGATVQHTSGADGQGFALRIEPSWGATQSRADELLNGDDALTDRAFDSSARMDTEIAYGIAYNEGMMTPYSGFRFVDGGRTYRIGARYKLRPIPLEMRFEAYRKQHVDIENGVLLKASVHW